MILVSYDPFAVNGGSIYITKEKDNTEFIKHIDSTISELAEAAIAAAYNNNQYDICFQPQFDGDMAEFVNAVECYEALKYNDNKIKISEVNK